MNLSRLVYISDAVRPLSEPELQQLVARSHAKNESRGVTGLLLAGGGQFVQVLEGELEVVAQVFDVIRLDPRHRNVQRLLFEFTPERLFPAWWMGLLDVDQAPAVDRHVWRRPCGWVRNAAATRAGRGKPSWRCSASSRPNS